MARVPCGTPHAGGGPNHKTQDDFHLGDHRARIKTRWRGLGGECHVSRGWDHGKCRVGVPIGDVPENVIFAVRA